MADVGLSFGEFSAEDMSAYFSQSAKVDAVVLRPFDTVVVARVPPPPFLACSADIHAADIQIARLATKGHRLCAGGCQRYGSRW